MSRRDELDLLLRILDQSYNRPAWHGPNLRGALRAIGASEAVRRPAARRHNIAEIALHCAYWKHVVRRRLTGDRSARFPLQGRDWFEVPELNEEAWADYRALLERTHAALRAAIAALDPARLHLPAAGSRQQSSVLVFGIASHDVYHAGQIRLVRRLIRGNR